MRVNRGLRNFMIVLLLLHPLPVGAANINVVWTSEVGQFAPLWVTKEAKLFEKYGNTVQLIFIQGASSAAAALSSGDAQVGMFSPQVVISTPALELVMFGRLGNTMDNRVYGKKGIKSIKEVKRIAISRYGSNADFAARFLLQREGLRPDVDVALLQFGNQSNRIAAVETGGCPHTAIREDASMNLAAVADMRAKFPDLDLVLIESGGDNLAATFSPELADLTIYVIDVAAGDKIPSKGGPGITRSDLLVINKIDLAPHVGADLAVMARDAQRQRGDRPFVFTNLRTGEGVDAVLEWARRDLLLPISA